MLHSILNSLLILVYIIRFIPKEQQKLYVPIRGNVVILGKGKCHLDCGIPKELHKELRFLAVKHDTSIKRYVKAC